MFSLIKNLFKKSREQKILEKCGCVCYCPNCSEPLNDTSRCISHSIEDTYTYTCVKCNFESDFDFGIAPVPIYIKKEFK